MKYIKYFEGITINDNLPSNATFKIGDYVFIRKGRSYPEWQNLMFKIASLDQNSVGNFKDPSNYLWEIRLDDVQLWFPARSLRKAKDHEIEAKKYNL